MAKRLKRAFTIVELVIVIAVIAILAAVLIPTFTTLIDKANESNDIALVKNLNTALVSKEATDEVNTMQDALDAAYEYGYTVDKLTPSSSGDIVWDEVNNRFALINEKKEVVFEDGAKPLTNDATKIWKIVTELKGAQDCSWYVGGLSKEAIEKFTFTMGVDTGSVEANVNYASDSTQNVTIHTAGGTLTVKGHTVNHYGTAQSVDVKEVAEESYHEYGQVTGNLTITKGHVVFESTAVVNTFVVADDATTVKATVNDKAQVLTAVANDSATLTDLNLPATVETVVADKDDLAMFAGGAGTEKSPYQIATAEQFLNIDKLNLFSTANVAAFELINNISLTSEEAVSYGTDKPNYYVNNFDNAIFDGNGYKVSVTADNTYIFGRLVGTVIKNVEFALDGTHIVISGWDKVYDTEFNAVTTSGEVNFPDRNTALFVGYAGTGDSAVVGDIVFTKCVNNASIYGKGELTRYNAIFVGYAWGSLDLTFTDCVNNGSLLCGKAALFLGNQSKALNHVALTINNFVSNGNVFSFYQGTGYTQNDYIASSVGKDTTVITIDGVERDLSYDLSVNVTQVPSSSKTPEIVYNPDKTFTLTNPSREISYYEVTYSTYVQWWELNAGGTQYTYEGTQVVYITERVNRTDFVNGSYKTKMKWLDLATSGKRGEGTVSTLGDKEIVTIGDKQYYLIEDTEAVRLNSQAPQKENGNNVPVNKEDLQESFISVGKDINVLGYDVNGHLMVGSYVKITEI